MIAVMRSGARISVIPGEGCDDRCFAGELLNPTEREMIGGAHVSTCWDRSKIERVEPCAPHEPNFESDAANSDVAPSTGAAA